MNQGIQGPTGTSGPVGVQGQRAPAPSNDPLEQAFRTLAQLEPDAQALDVALTATSIAISLKRIADALNNHQGSMTYDMNRLRDSIIANDGSLNKIANNVERLANETAARRST